MWAAKCVEEARKGCKISLLVPLCPTAGWCKVLYADSPWVFAPKERLMYGGAGHTVSRADQLVLLGAWSKAEVKSLIFGSRDLLWYMGKVGALHYDDDPVFWFDGQVQ